MTVPKQSTPGEPITASRMNEIRAESIRPRRDVSVTNASTFVNEAMGNQSANMSRPYLKLVEAIEDFDIQYSPTDLNGAIDDVPSGLVKQVRLDRRTGEHSKSVITGSFRAWDVLQGLNDAESKATGDTFYVAYNEDSKRWEVLGQAVGGAKRIWFEIQSCECVGTTDLVLVVLPIWYTGGCTATIPGEDTYGLVEVEDICSILQFYTKEFLESGAKGSATYMFPRNGACDPKWLLDEICGAPNCADT